MHEIGTKQRSTFGKFLKWAAILGGGFILLLIVIGGIVGSHTKPATGVAQDTASSTPAEQAVDSATEDVGVDASVSATEGTKREPEHTSEPVTPAGLGVSRHHIMSTMGDLYSFEKGKDLDGKENYVATGATTMIQIVGPADDVTTASVTGLFDNDQSRTTGTMAVVLTFVSAFGDDGIGNWLQGEIGKAGVGKQVDDEEVIGRHSYRFQLFAIGQTPTLTLSVHPL